MQENLFFNAEPKQDVHEGCYEDYDFEWENNSCKSTSQAQSISNGTTKTISENYIIQI